MSRVYLLALVLVPFLTGCALTKEEKTGLESGKGRVVALATDARRNLGKRMVLSRLLADRLIDNTLDRVAAGQKGMVSADFAKVIAKIRMRVEAALRGIESAELANIRGNARQGKQLIDEVLDANSNRAKIERDDWQIIKSTVDDGLKAWKASRTKPKPEGS